MKKRLGLALLLSILLVLNVFSIKQYKYWKRMSKNYEKMNISVDREIIYLQNKYEHSPDTVEQLVREEQELMLKLDSCLTQ